MFTYVSNANYFTGTDIPLSSSLMITYSISRKKRRFCSLIRKVELRYRCNDAKYKFDNYIK